MDFVFTYSQTSGTKFGQKRGGKTVSQTIQLVDIYVSLGPTLITDKRI